MVCCHFNGIGHSKPPRLVSFDGEKGHIEPWHAPSSIDGMKTNAKIIALAMGISNLAALPLMSRPVGVGVQVQIVAPPPPVVTVQVPAPEVTVQIGVPDFYVWDGCEYVGAVGDQFYYLGPGRVWIVCDPVRLARWHDWEAVHADWRIHATVNKHYRRDAQGHDYPWHDERSQDKDRDHGHGH